MSVYILTFILFSIGLYCTVRKRNLVKIIIGIGIMGYAVNLFLILAGYRNGCSAPIGSHGDVGLCMVDPLPQAVVMVAIVIGLATMLLLIALALRIYEKYGTFDITKINKLKG